MKRFHFFFLFLSVVAVGAWAQTAAPRREAAAEQLPPDLRRSELRETLKKMQMSQSQQNGPVVDAETLEPRRTYDRHLSAQERADLREQLRQLSADGLLNVTAK
ncbi:MAG: hypothetical protein GZ093_15490 [Rhodoferax sp.]|uniref:hypothetical protein n=1 Tax=Rhodoferax sp. TaxID=50421 RepID=UPI0013FF9AE2|nr:hypothetical protein [Rhodoferax sp.]NDP40128.1 hypothetical protein [Rhodoferax sp.]